MFRPAASSPLLDPGPHYIGATVLVQQTLANPQDYEVYDAGTWNRCPFRPEPADQQQGGLDDIPGHIMTINLQGNKIEGDHYHVGYVFDEVLGLWCTKVTMWNNDPDDWQGDEMWAEEWTVTPLVEDHRPPLNGVPNTVQKLVVYCAPGSFEWNKDPSVNREVRDAALFVEPQIDVRHGIWVSTPLYEEHKRVRTAYDWQSWLADQTRSEADLAELKTREIVYETPGGEVRKPYWQNHPMW